MVFVDVCQFGCEYDDDVNLLCATACIRIEVFVHGIWLQIQHLPCPVGDDLCCSCVRHLDRRGTAV